MPTKNNKIFYICSECGYESKKWIGKCPDCGNWNTMFEEVASGTLKNQNSNNKILSTPQIIIENQRLLDIDIKKEIRIDTGFKELNCVLGGGIVKGSVILLSGSPGVGKSTLLLQLCQFVSKSFPVFYFSGEESEKQIRLRANRLGVNNSEIYIVSENNVLEIFDLIFDLTENLSKKNPNQKSFDPKNLNQNKNLIPGLIIIDSIQTMRNPEVASIAGSITQVRESTNLLMSLAKKTNIPIIIVGHVNKDGGIAGPKVLEHIVDTVLHFDAEKNNLYKILRTSKNRFGATNEIGIFQMEHSGLVEVKNPSMALIGDRSENMSGTAVVCIMEGSRPIFVEVQALVSKSDFAMPRRVTTGFDYNRIYFVLAILEKKCGYSFNKLDVYVNIVGGIKLSSPSADLAVATAIVSSLKENTVDSDMVIIGELGLTGEIRPVSFITERIKESVKLGFKKCVIPKASLRTLKNDLNLEKLESVIKLIPIKYIWEYFK